MPITSRIQPRGETRSWLDRWLSPLTEVGVGGDVIPAGVVYLGTLILRVTVDEFVLANIAMTLVWVGAALALLEPQRALPRLALRPVATAAAFLLAVVSLAGPAAPAWEQTVSCPWCASCRP